MAELYMRGRILSRGRKHIRQSVYFFGWEPRPPARRYGTRWYFFGG